MQNSIQQEFPLITRCGARTGKGSIAVGDTRERMRRQMVAKMAAIGGGSKRGRALGRRRGRRRRLSLPGTRLAGEFRRSLVRADYRLTISGHWRAITLQSARARQTSNDATGRRINQVNARRCACTIATPHLPARLA